MKKLVLPVLLILLGTVLVGCPSPKPENWSCPELSTPTVTAKISSNPDKPEKIIIQIDGTPSMKGFVSDRNSRYIRTLRLLRSATNTAFPVTPSPTFYVFGTQRLKEPINHQSAETAWFYSGGRPELRDAATHKIIAPQKTDPPNSLYVIVTDLYQEKAQWEDLVAQLKDNYLLKDGYAVGIIAVKSEFLGDIYDVGLDNIRYPSVKTNHPFYILVLGRYSQVKQYFDKIKSESQNTGLDFPAENFVIFSTQIFEKPALLQINDNEQPTPSSSSPTSDNPQKSGIRRVEVINDGRIVIKKVENPQNVERLIIPSQTSNDSPKETSLKYRLNYNPLPYTLPLGNSASYQLNGDSDFNNNTKEFKKLDPQSSLIPLQLTNWQSTNNQLEFNALINLDNNPQGIGVYRLIFDVFPEKISGSSRPYQAPSWWKDWSFGENEIFAGDRTYNLQPFLYNLGDTTFRIIENKPNVALGRLCFIIHKK